MKTSNILRADLFYEANVGTDNIPTLLNEIYKVKNNNASIENTNSNCWRSYYRYSNLDWLLTKVINFVDCAIDFYKEKDEMFKSIEFKKPYKISYWTNINGYGSRNTMHTHSGSHFACVYYLQAHGTGDLRLINPANSLSNCMQTAPFTRDFYFKPSDGDLILWPAWVPHEVEPNMSDKDRVNIIFDIIL